MMRALTVAPGTANSARVEDVPEPPRSDGAVLVRTLALGVCGTDREIVSGSYGWAPPGEKRLVIGHELLGEVCEAPADSGFRPGDRVVGIVRRPDPVPCPACAVGEWDMCRNGRYTERGIKERNGYGADFFRIEPDFLVKVDRVARRRRRAGRADQRRRQGLGSYRAHRPALAGMAAADAAGHRRRADRPSCRIAGCATRPRRPCTRPS